MVVMMIMMMMIFKKKMTVFQEINVTYHIIYFHAAQCLLGSHSAALQESPMKQDKLICG